MIRKPNDRAPEAPLHGAIGHALHDCGRIRAVTRFGSAIYFFSSVGFLLGLISASINTKSH